MVAVPVRKTEAVGVGPWAWVLKARPDYLRIAIHNVMDLDRRAIAITIIPPVSQSPEITDPSRLFHKVIMLQIDQRSTDDDHGKTMGSDSPYFIGFS